jgi:hypothetical protein
VITLTEFVLSRIVEREIVAREVITERERTKWRWGHEPGDDWDVYPDTDAWTPHVAVGAELMLAECERDRRLVALHTGPHECPAMDSNCGWWTPGEVGHDGDRETVAPECPTLRLMALPHAARPEFREEWKL